MTCRVGLIGVKEVLLYSHLSTSHQEVRHPAVLYSGIVMLLRLGDP